VFAKPEQDSFWYYGEYSAYYYFFSAVYLEDNRAFDIFSTSGRLGVFGDRQSLVRYCYAETAKAFPGKYQVRR